MFVRRREAYSHVSSFYKQTLPEPSTCLSFGGKNSNRYCTWGVDEPPLPLAPGVITYLLLPLLSLQPAFGKVRVPRFWQVFEFRSLLPALIVVFEIQFQFQVGPLWFYIKIPIVVLFSLLFVEWVRLVHLGGLVLIFCANPACFLNKVCAI